MVLLDYSKEYLTVIKILDTNHTPDIVLNILIQPIDRFFLRHRMHTSYKHLKKWSSFFLAYLTLKMHKINNKYGLEQGPCHTTRHCRHAPDTRADMSVNKK